MCFSPHKPTLSHGDNKDFVAYEIASSRYRKRQTLIELHDKNPSLELFVKQLDGLRAAIMAQRSTQRQNDKLADTGEEAK